MVDLCPCSQMSIAPQLIVLIEEDEDEVERLQELEVVEDFQEMCLEDFQIQQGSCTYELTLIVPPGTKLANTQAKTTILYTAYAYAFLVCQYKIIPNYITSMPS